MAARFVVLSLGAVLVGTPVLSPINPVPAADQPALVGQVQKAVVRALNFDRGDVERLRGARDEFTPEGWKASETEYLRRTDGDAMPVRPG
jgi:hypothetical protein